MLDNKIKERIAQEARVARTKYVKEETEFGTRTSAVQYMGIAYKEGYIAGAEAEAARAAEGIKILKELCELKKYKDTLGKDSFYEKRQPELWQLATEFLTNYNNPVNK